MIYLRSAAFAAAFYSWTAVYALFLTWTLVMPRRALIGLIHVYLRSLNVLERRILGLNYVVVGREHLPKGPFILAGKHQSMWETMKIHLLVEDPAIVLKRELTWIPVWGWLAAKADMIAVNRGAKGVAMASMLGGARRVAAEGRPIVIFPQGTRVAAGQTRPYKAGVGVLYEQLGLPVVPMALNSGLFWPRRKFLKRGGTITVEFLPPIPPGLPRQDAMADLERRLEEASDRLSEAAGGPRANQRPAAREAAPQPVQG